MTTSHGTAWTSMQNAISRAKRHTDYELWLEERRSRAPGAYTKKTFIRSPERYAKAKEDARVTDLKHGISFLPRTEKERRVALLAAAARRADKRRRQSSQSASIDERQEAALRMVSIVNRAIDSLSIGLSLMLQAPGDPKVELPMTQAQAASAINILCDLVHRQRPDLLLERKPGPMPKLDRCTNCGLMLRKDETEYCDECGGFVRRRETLLSQRAQREKYAAQMHERDCEIKELRKMIEEMEEYARHGGHPHQNASAVETTGGRQDLSNPNSVAHRNCQDNPGNAEGRNGSGTS